MNRFFKKSEQIIYQSVFCIFVVIMISLSAFCILGYLTNGGVQGIAFMAFAIGMVLLLYILYKKRVFENQKLLWGIFVLGIILKIVYAIAFDFDIRSDMNKCYEAARQMAMGNLSWAKTSYFEIHTGQWLLVLYEALVLNIFKTVRALYLFNVLWSVITAYLIYLVVNRLNKDITVALIISCFYMFLPSSFLSIGILYSYIFVGLFLALIIYLSIILWELFQTKGKIWKKLGIFFLIGVISKISAQFKTDGNLPILALSCVSAYLVIKFLGEKDYRSLAEVLFGVFLMWMGFFGMKVVYQIIVWLCGLTLKSKKGTSLYWPLVVGLNPNHDGIYNTDYAYILDLSTQEKGKAFKVIMQEMTKDMNIFDWIMFYIRKMTKMWGSIDTTIGWGNLPSDSVFWKLIINFFMCLDKFIYSFFILLGAYGLKKKREDFVQKQGYLLLQAIVIAYYVMFIFVEIQTRYRFTPIIALSLVAPFGLCVLQEKGKFDRDGTDKV